MTILIVPILIAMAVLALLAWQAGRKGSLTLRGWAAAVLALSALASFPLSIISSAYLAIMPVGGYELAPWIRQAWRAYGWAAGFLWFAGAPVVAYDLPRGTMLVAADFPGRGETAEAREKDRRASFKVAVERLVAEHGGAAGE
jgi:hypothetical protein